MEEKIFQTWGYKPDGSAQIFDLREGESLPDGWSDRPELWNHPNTAHLHSRPELSQQSKPKRGRPPKSELGVAELAAEQIGRNEIAGAEFASELRDE